VPASASSSAIARVPIARAVDAPPGALVPELWAAGMKAATGDAVAITTSHFVPAPGWAAAAVGAMARTPAPAAGGPIPPPRGGSACDWATYFQRYSAYLALRDAGKPRDVDDVAGDNAWYRRAVLDEHADLVRDGFWELDLHRRLAKAHRPLAWVPEM